ncbi:DUF6443 domain-containing protein [Tenacibaculum soleae]|uniref:DUF6443 domain-containing protein n=1 Tax=Tenacibaculum soleae TaxID=447689 RepID=UPI0026E3CFD3|nr:DUF6443 domain-containing protein [Tenacibaculum soleae]MDO6812238.1 DUF6443 domain-containing protein [Tenacibaculum soleae]
MKKILYILIYIFPLVLLGQVKENVTKEGSYTVTGKETLTATNSIILKPNTWIKSGANFTARIVSDPYTSLNISNENYVLSRVFQTATQTGVVSNKKDVVEQITYYDGLGRAKQSIGIGQSPTCKDIVTHIEYDNLGRQTKNYLPYTSSDAGGAGAYREDALMRTNLFYNKNDYEYTTNPYSEFFFDGSPLNIINEIAAPGNDWKEGIVNEHTIKSEVKLIQESDEVYNFSVNLNSSNIPSLINKGHLVIGEKIQGAFTAPTLYKFITKNENWKISDQNNNTIHTFKDYRGRVILKRTFESNIPHNTYYVYDIYGNLTFVLPPKVIINDGISSTELNELCYQYKYDHRNRLVEKKIPGKGWEYIVYDKLDRPVLTQDANLRSVNNNSTVDDKKWLFTKYDALGRVVYTGLYTHTTVLTGSQMQAHFDSENNTPAEYFEEKKDIPESLGIYYTNSDFPKLNLEVFTVNYYDNYTFDRAGTTTSINNIYGVNSTMRLKGLATGSKVKVLGESPVKWITTVSYYDEKARPIQVYSHNEYLESTDIVKSKLDFVGKVEETTSIHTKTDDNLPTLTLVLTDKFEYDHVGRLTRQTQEGTNITGIEVITENTYDELGQLKRKNVGGKTTHGRLQNVDYTYNVRGWLKNINQDSNTTDNDLFNFTINYNNPTSTGTALFNGNISQTSWNTLSADKSAKMYNYRYDALNRITSATGVLGNKYDVSGIIYDKNGNIRNLQRNGHIVENPIASNSSGFGLMDNLKYTYANNNTSNQLIKVEELTGGNATYGFKDGANATTEYIYDVNGNMTKDLNKGITNITYNHLNLPTRVTIGGKNIDYTYDAAGIKLSKTVNGVTTQYAGNYVYGNNVLQFFNHPEGYVTPKNANDITQGFKYVYQYKDHLGNVRLSYADNDNNGIIDASTEIIEESNYYPFGLKHKGYNTVTQPIGNSVAQKKGYANKELEEDLGLNTIAYGWRDYDPALARFNKIDRFAEKYKNNSPYNFTLNNPINYPEIAGDSINLKLIIRHDRNEGTNYAQQIVDDLTKVTGLMLNLDQKSGMLTYAKNEDGEAIDNGHVSEDGEFTAGSETAKKDLISAIDNKKKGYGRIQTRSKAGRGGSLINIGPKQVEDFINGTKNMNKTSLGFGMTFLHEMQHSAFGLGVGDDKSAFGRTGKVVDRMNTIRKELGSSYGQRTSYMGMNLGGSKTYIPFDKGAKRRLSSGSTPSSKSQKFIEY